MTDSIVKNISFDIMDILINSLTILKLMNYLCQGDLF